MYQQTLRTESNEVVKFNGRLISRVDDKKSNFKRRWNEFLIYLTDKDTYFCVQVFHSNLKNDKKLYKMKECDSILELKQFFGEGWLARDLYKDAFID